jgi:hypothetical protein
MCDCGAIADWAGEEKDRRIKAEARVKRLEGALERYEDELRVQRSSCAVEPPCVFCDSIDKALAEGAALAGEAP